MHDAVRHVPEAVVERHGQHAHVERERAAVIAGDQHRAIAIEVMQPLYGIAVIALPKTPVPRPPDERDLLGDRGGTRAKGLQERRDHRLC